MLVNTSSRTSGIFTRMLEEHDYGMQLPALRAAADARCWANNDEAQ